MSTWPLTFLLWCLWVEIGAWDCKQPGPGLSIHHPGRTGEERLLPPTRFSHRKEPRLPFRLSVKHASQFQSQDMIRSIVQRYKLKSFCMQTFPSPAIPSHPPLFFVLLLPGFMEASPRILVNRKPLMEREREIGRGGRGTPHNPFLFLPPRVFFFFFFFFFFIFFYYIEKNIFSNKQ